MNPIKFEDVKVGTKFYDKDYEDTMTVTEIEDIHNVIAEDSKGNWGYYCLEKDCEQYEAIYESD